MIELQKWKPHPDDPRYVVPDGQPTAFEVFNELKQQLESIGLLPDEYFQLGSYWRNEREIPPEAWISNEVDYGASEGIYLHIYLHWNDEDGNRQNKNFATGKTLGEGYEDLKRMNLTAAAVTQAFHAPGVHARYMVVGGENSKSYLDEGVTLSLNADERKLLVDSLLLARTVQKADELAPIDRLLRRTIGSVTEFMQTVGYRDNLSDADLIELAIQDSNISVFLEMLPKAENCHELLVKVAGHPGRIGEQMTVATLQRCSAMPVELYEQACIAAVDIGDTHRVMMLLQNADTVTQTDCTSLPGRVLVASMTYRDIEHYPGTKMAEEIFKSLNENQTKAISSTAFMLAWEKKNYSLAHSLVKGGIDLSDQAAKLYWKAAKEYDSHLFSLLEKAGADINSHYGWPLRYAMEQNQPEAAKFLLENGADSSVLTEMVNENGQAFYNSLLEKYPELAPKDDAEQAPTAVEEPQM